MADRQAALQNLQNRLAALAASSGSASSTAGAGGSGSVRRDFRSSLIGGGGGGGGAATSGGATTTPSRPLSAADLSLLLKKPTVHLATDDRIVLDVGSLYTKIGFASEHSPRFVVQNRASPSLALYKDAGTATPGPSELAGDELTQFWDESFAEADVPLVELYLRQHFFDVFFKYLLTDPKGKTVIVCENALLPVLLKQTIAAVLLDQYQVASVQFALAPSMTLLTMGCEHGLVVDCGNIETQAVPIYDSRPLYSYMTTVPLAGIYIVKNLADLLIKFGSLLTPLQSEPGSENADDPAYQHPHAFAGQPMTPLHSFWLKFADWALGQPTDMPQNPFTHNFTLIPWTQQNAAHLLTLEFLEDVKARCCYVGARATAEDFVLVTEPTPEDLTSPASSPQTRVRQLQQDREGGGGGTALPTRRMSFTPQGMLEPAAAPTSAVLSPIESSPPTSPTSRTSAAAGGPPRLISRYKIYQSTASTVYYPLGDRGMAIGGNKNMKLILPGWVRERAAEVLFEGDDDGKSVPSDIRRALASNIVLSGGTTHTPGFMGRLHKELLYTIASQEQYKQLRGLSAHLRLVTPGHGQFACGAWVGTSLAANLKLINPAAETTLKQYETAKKDAAPDQPRLVLPSVYDWTAGARSTAYGSREQLSPRSTPAPVR
ncbi:hypothetical protein RI367_006749 [Sorochytrium milnesiophthora]